MYKQIVSQKTQFTHDMPDKISIATICETEQQQSNAKKKSCFSYAHKGRTGILRNKPKD